MLLKEKLTELINTEAADFPFISAYIDLTPNLSAGTVPVDVAQADAPRRSPDRDAAPQHRHVRPGIRQMFDMLRDKEKLVAKHGSDRESFDADEAKILDYLNTAQFDTASQGVALFACSGADVWHVVETPVALETKLFVDKTPYVYPLTHLDDDYERFALCVTDSETARIYVSVAGKVESETELQGEEVRRSKAGNNLSQKRYQQRTDNTVANHIRDVAAHLQKLVTRDNIGRIVLAGEETVRTEFRRHLSEEVWERVVAVERFDKGMSDDAKVSHAMQAVLEAEKEEGLDVARLALQETMAHRLGTAGEEGVRYALSQGAVSVLVLDPLYGSEEVREDLTEQALQTAATVEFVEGSEEMERMGGVAALLRWQPDPLFASRGLEDAEEMSQMSKEGRRTENNGG